MENRRSPELPDVIIQHIQSFLKTSEAARSILVSKSWLRAWSTHPFLSFAHHTPSKVIDRTLKSYVEHRTPIVRFHLHVKTIQERWLKMALQSNVIELHLTARKNWTDNLIHEILITKSIQVLRIVSQGFKFLLNFSHSDIKCLNLRKLQLLNLNIGEVSLQLILSSCPLIEELLLIKCRLLDYSPYYIGICSFTFTDECTSLKRLSLDNTEINDDQLYIILSKSPHLEDLSLICCNKLVKPINLSKVALKRVNIDRCSVQVVLVDTPNLQKLKYTSSDYPSIPFPITISSPITKGVVKVTIVYDSTEIDESWFHGLREFLTKFAKSNVKFTLDYDYPLRIDFKVLRAIPPCGQVEILRFKGYKDRPLLFAFFSICHPKAVILDRLDTMSKPKLLKKLLKDLSCEGNLDCCNFNDQNKCWRHYIKGAKLYYEVDNEKKPLDMIGLKTGLGSKEVITLALEWESS